MKVSFLLHGKDNAGREGKEWHSQYTNIITNLCNQNL